MHVRTQKAIAKPVVPHIATNTPGQFIGGRWHASLSGRTFTTFNPSTGKPLAEIPYADERDVNSAVAAAAQAFTDWCRTPVRERARCLHLLAQRIRDNSDNLALLDAVDSGNAVIGMKGDMEWTAD